MANGGERGWAKCRGRGRRRMAGLVDDRELSPCPWPWSTTANDGGEGEGEHKRVSISWSWRRRDE